MHLLTTSIKCGEHHLLVSSINTSNKIILKHFGEGPFVVCQFGAHFVDYYGLVNCGQGPRDLTKTEESLRTQNARTILGHGYRFNTPDRGHN